MPLKEGEALSGGSPFYWEVNASSCSFSSSTYTMMSRLAQRQQWVLVSLESLPLRAPLPSACVLIPLWVFVSHVYIYTYIIARWCLSHLVDRFWGVAKPSVTMNPNAQVLTLVTRSCGCFLSCSATQFYALRKRAQEYLALTTVFFVCSCFSLLRKLWLSLYLLFYQPCIPHHPSPRFYPWSHWWKHYSSLRILLEIILSLEGRQCSHPTEILLAPWY